MAYLTLVYTYEMLVYECSKLYSIWVNILTIRICWRLLVKASYIEFYKAGPKHESVVQKDEKCLT
jgi:hypothetical protein